MADLDPHVSELIRVVKEEIQGIHPNGTFGPGTIAGLWKTIDAIEAPAPSQPQEGGPLGDGLPWTVDDTATLRRVFTAMGEAFPVSNEIPDSHLIRYVRATMEWILGPKVRAPIPPRADPGRECLVLWEGTRPHPATLHKDADEKEETRRCRPEYEWVRMVEAPPHAGGRDLALYENPEGHPCPKCKQTHNHFHEQAGGAV